MTTQSKIALAIGGALATGVIIGLLVAPDKGSEMRKKVKDKTGKVVDELTRLFSHAGHEERLDGQAVQSEVKRGKGMSTTVE